MKKQNGITLVALVITIIILIILTGITIGALQNNGLFEKAQYARNVAQDAKNDEETKINSYEEVLNDELTKYNAAY